GRRRDRRRAARAPRSRRAAPSRRAPARRRRRRRCAAPGSARRPRTPGSSAPSLRRGTGPRVCPRRQTLSSAAPPRFFRLRQKSSVPASAATAAAIAGLFGLPPSTAGTALFAFLFATRLPTLHVSQPSTALRLLTIPIPAPFLVLRLCGRPALRRQVDRPAERDEPRLLDRLRQRRVRRDPVRDRLDRRLGVQRDDARFDHVRDVWADHDEPEELAVPGLVDRLDPA